MDKQIIVDINCIETAVALVEDGELAELYFERKGKEKLVGNIYVGRVENVLPGMQAAFVNIGIDKNAFLYAGDILSETSDLEFSDQKIKPKIERSISDIVKQGQNVLVQVLKEPEGTKGARITANITLPGRNLVLMPTVDYIGVSRRIDGEEERERLRNLVDELRPSGMGVIVRTAGMDKSSDEFAKEIFYLEKLWGRIVKNAAVALPPYLINQESGLVSRVVRDLINDDVSSITVNDENSWRSIVDLAEVELSYDVGKIKLLDDIDNLLEHFGLQSKIDRLFNKKVWLKSGGYIIIEETEALTVVDVNTGKYTGDKNFDETIFRTNIEAGIEIAKQLRLRDIGGIIVIDFIDMRDEESKAKLLESLQEEMKKDRVKCNVVGMTGLGLVEMTRKKVRKKLTSILQDECHKCNGTGRVLSAQSVAIKIRRKLKKELSSSSQENWLLVCSKELEATVVGQSDEGKSIIDGLNDKNLFVKGSQYFDKGEFDLSPLRDEKELRKAERKYRKVRS